MYNEKREELSIYAFCMNSILVKTALFYAKKHHHIFFKHDNYKNFNKNTSKHFLLPTLKPLS
jgi:hypothetical protein